MFAETFFGNYFIMADIVCDYTALVGAQLFFKAMAPHSSTLAWKIPWMEEPGRSQSMELQRVGHNRVPNTFAFISAIGIKSENRNISDKLTAPELELSFLIMTDLDIQVSTHTEVRCLWLREGFPCFLLSAVSSCPAHSWYSLNSR